MHLLLTKKQQKKRYWKVTLRLVQ
uniref:Uncharacterized protein n=1 Tax=Arundo donax TaxID=35708 RepID=A0A0A8ZVS0_ARUDO